MSTFTGVHHLALTVADRDRSVAWYRDLLGLVEITSGEDDGVRWTVTAHLDSGLAMGFREYTAGGTAFDHRTPGLDHLALQVADEEELAAWEEELQRRDIDFTPCADHPIGKVVTFRDPDGIQLEFWLPTV